MPAKDKDPVAAAYRVINDADPETAKAADRLRALYKRVGEDDEVGERAIDGMLESGPGAVDRLRATHSAVARLHGIDVED